MSAGRACASPLPLCVDLGRAQKQLSCAAGCEWAESPPPRKTHVCGVIGPNRALKPSPTQFWLCAGFTNKSVLKRADLV